jgi:hypothetical protein
MQRTPKGRVATAQSYKYLGVEQDNENADDPDLFNSSS